MSDILLHDNNNPQQEKYLDAASITGVEQVGSGSMVNCGGVLYNVVETPAQVEALRKAALA